MVTYETSQIDFIDPEYGDTFFFLNLRMSGNKASYNRQYQKIQSVLAQISGTMGLITIVIGIVAVPYARSYMYELLINEAYNIVDKSKTKKSAKRRSKTKQKIIRKAQNDEKKGDDVQLVSKEDSIASKVIREHLLENHNSSAIESPDLDQTPDTSHVMLNQNRLQETQLIKVSKGSKQGIIADSGFHSLLAPEKQILDEDNLQCHPINNGEELKTPLDTEFGLTVSERRDNENTSNIHQALKGHGSSKLLNQKTPIIGQNSPIQANSEPPGKQINNNPYTIITPSGRVETNSRKVFEQDEDQESTARKPGLIAVTKSGQEGTPFKQWFMSNFKSSAKSKALAKGKEEVLKNVDVFSIIRRFQEIDNLKACLLTEYQRVLFDNIAKPSLVINPDRKPNDPNFITVEG